MAVCQCFPRRSWPSQCLALSPHCFALPRTGSFLLPRHVAHRQLAIVGHLIEFGIGPSVMIIWILLGEYCKLPQRVGVVVRVLFFPVLARVYKSAIACPNPSGYCWLPLSSLLPVTWPRSLRATRVLCGREVLGRHLAGQLREPLHASVHHRGLHRLSPKAPHVGAHFLHKRLRINVCMRSCFSMREVAGCSTMVVIKRAAAR